MLYDNMIYFACYVASHGAQYDLLDQCVWQVIIIVLQGLYLLNTACMPFLFYCNFILLLVVFI